MRNVAVAAVNGTITLIVLLIAPLGLAAVLINTLLVTASTFLVSTLMDFVVRWLLPASQSAKRMSQWQMRRNFEPIKEIHPQKWD